MYIQGRRGARICAKVSCFMPAKLSSSGFSLPLDWRIGSSKKLDCTLRLAQSCGRALIEGARTMECIPGP